MTERDSPVVVRPNMARALRAVAVIGPAILLVLLRWPKLREVATDPLGVVILLLLVGPVAIGPVAYLVAFWLRARVEVDARSLRVTGATGRTRTVTRDRLGSIVRCAVPSGFMGVHAPMALLLDRNGRYVLKLGIFFDLERVAAELGVPLVGNVGDRMTRAEAEARYGFPRQSVKVFAVVVIVMVAYTVAAIAFIIYVL